MDFVANTITEHYKQEGILEGIKQGMQQGRLEGAVEAFKTLYKEGLLSKEQLEAKIAKFSPEP